MITENLTIDTSSRTEFKDITRLVAAVVSKSGVKSGVCHVYVPHTTAGVTINENADPSVRQDIAMVLDRLVPWSAGYAHDEGNSAAHVKASLMGLAATVPVERGQLLLGTWQGIYFCEFDGPRSRQVLVKVVEG
jgi:secondary thiamine-phosphate synthase enzyme